MSQPNPSNSPVGKRTPLKFLANLAIVGFFAIGVVVSAGSFGLFGCWCTDGFTRREKPADAPLKTGEMPPLPFPGK